MKQCKDCRWNKRKCPDWFRKKCREKGHLYYLPKFHIALMFWRKK